MFVKIINTDPETLLKKALQFKNNADYTNYFICLTMACNLNNRESVEEFKKNCLELFPQQDFNVTRHFYQETLNFSYSSNNMGYLYEEGLGVMKNYEKAVKLYQFAVDKGLDISMQSLAKCYEEGKGVEKNLNKAIELLKMGIDIGDPACMNDLGHTYNNKLKNYDMAIKYYEMAIDKNYEISLSNLINLYKRRKFLRDKKCVVNYFIKIGKENCLKDIYFYDDEDIVLLKERFNFEQELQKSKKENAEMKTHILASPDGPLYFEVLEQWKNKFGKL